jgi:hypothetical protein
MPDVAVRAVCYQKGSFLDCRADIEMTQAHDLHGPTCQQQGGNEKWQGQKVKFTPTCTGS